MDPCRRIWFTSPLTLFAQFLGIVAMFVFIVAAFALFN